MNSSPKFFDLISQKHEKVHSNLDSYLKEPNEENIHNIRTSIRRLESAYLILPKSCKTKSSDKHMEKLKDFFSQNNRIRDFDIILEKLQSYGYDPESKIILTLQKKKLIRLKNSLVVGEKLSRNKKFKIKKQGNIYAKFEKKIASLIDDFRNFVPIVVSNELKIEELHSMRKTIKKLRYVLELEPNNSYHNLISQMKKLQQILGEIHDCDILIWYFQKRKEKTPEYTKLIESEKTKRSTIYQNLVLMLSNFK